MIQINLSAETIDEVQQDLTKLLSGISGGDTAKPLAAERAALDVKPSPYIADKPVAEDKPEPKAAPVEPEAVPTMEETRAKLNALRVKKSPKDIRAILTAQGVGSFTELKPEQYAAVIEAVDVALQA